MTIKKIKKWNDLHAVLMLLAGACSLYWQQLSVLAIVAAVSFLYHIIDHWKYLKSLSPVGGYANYVTAFRLLLLIIIGTCFLVLSNWAISIILILVVLLDVLDGFLARKLNQQSDFGLYFDMETDAYFVALAACMLYLKGMAPAWILIVGFMRYLNVAVYQILQLKPKKEAKQRFASTIAGTLFVVLALSFVFPSTIRYYSNYRKHLYYIRYLMILK